MKNNIEIKKIIKKVKKKNNFTSIILFKLFLVSFLLLGLYYFNTSYTNSINLLAVNEGDSNGVKTGSLVKLTLTIKPGSGNTFVNLNTIEEMDTQISIINSQKIACNLFSLNCNEFDFYYSFEGSALFLKGPSASSAIAILTAKTINKKKISDKIAITGSLNSGGLIGNVGGVDTKISVAKEHGFKKVIVPVFSKFNQSLHPDIDVIKSLDIIEAYNVFGENFKLKKRDDVKNSNYKLLMKDLANSICDKSFELKNEINLSLIDKNSSLYSYKVQANKSLNSSFLALENENYYSMGSFCFNSNINYRILLEREKNLSLKQINENIKEFEKELNLKYVTISSENYKNKIITINDFYVYLLITDRLNEARDLISKAVDDVKKTQFTKINKNENITNKNQTNNTNNINNSSTINSSTILKINLLSDLQIKLKKENLYAFAKERYFTVLLWEKLIQNQGKSVNLKDEKIREACIKITREISLKSQLINGYDIKLFNSEVNKQKILSSNSKDKYLCIYKGLELNGKLNTILSSISINSNKQKIYTKKIVDFSKSRLGLHSNGDFPLIPYIYSQYAQELLEQNDFGSSMLYSNYAISYADLNLYIESKKDPIPIINKIIKQLMDNPFFIGLILLIIVFMN